MIPDYFRAVRKHYWGLLGGSALGLVGLASLKWHLAIPWWGWFIGFFGGLTHSQYAAWAEMRQERDAAVSDRAEAIRERDEARSQSSPKVSLTFDHGSGMSHVGQVYGEGPHGGPGVIPMTPFLMEMQRRSWVLHDAARLYEAEHDRTVDPARGTMIPADWMEAYLSKLGLTWRLREYRTDIRPQELMADYEQ